MVYEVEGTTNDQETNDRIAKGERPNAIGWPAISRVLKVDTRTAMRWEKRFALPIFLWGTYVAAYPDRLQAALLKSAKRTEAA